MDQYRSLLEEIAKLVERSFMDKDSKNRYLNAYRARLKALHHAGTCCESAIATPFNSPAF